VSLAALANPYSSEAQVLDRVEIVETPDTAEIHIIFNARAVYLRHTPPEKGDLIRIFLGFPDFDRSQRFARELVSPPPSDLIPKFSVIFPDQATNGLTVQFERPVRFRISQRDIRSASRIVIAVKLDRPVPLPPVQPGKGVPEAALPPAGGPTPLFDTPPIRPGADVEKYAEDVMKLGHEALNAGENEKAIQAFNAILKLPQNKQSQGAQEWIGVVRQRSGDNVKAKAEYELYLKLYPEGADAKRVRGRLETLQKAADQSALTRTGKPIRKIDETKVYGSLYTYYYGGFSQESRTDKTTNTTTDLTNHDQSLVQAAFDVTGRYRKDEYDNKVVARGTQMYNDLATTDVRRNISRLRALYFETSRQDWYMFRIGRQPGNGGGILDYRFDGAYLRVTAVPQLLNINVVGGQPRQFSFGSAYVPDDPRNFRAELNRYFYGVNVDIGPVAQAWSGNAYFFNQMVNGVVDRRAIGSELRYASNGKNAFGLVDYDISYGALNIAMFNGTWVTENTTFTFMADHRRTPYLQTTNALFSPALSSSASLTLIKPENEALLRSQAKAITATSDLFLAGVLHSVTQDWQIGGDVRLNRISDTQGSKQCLQILPGTSTLFLNPNATLDAPCTVQALPGTGNIWTFSGQAIGNRFPTESMTLVMNGSYITNEAYKAQTFTVNSLMRINPQFQFDTFVILYHQKDNLGVDLYRMTPTLRMNYRFFNNWTLEGSGGFEQSLSYSATQKDSMRREFFFLGLRWDFS
jgi:tetratricopeptide (TPR) repeat protein